MEQSQESTQKPVRSRRIKWATYKAGLENNPVLAPFDLEPVTDIPIRLAVEQGYLKNKRDLDLFQLKEEWNGHPVRSIVIAGKMEEGREFAIWIADDKEHHVDKKAIAKKLAEEELEESAQSKQEEEILLISQSAEPYPSLSISQQPKPLPAKIHLTYSPKVQGCNYRLNFHPRIAPKFHIFKIGKIQQEIY